LDKVKSSRVDYAAPKALTCVVNMPQNVKNGKSCSCNWQQVLLTRLAAIVSQVVGDETQKMPTKTPIELNQIFEGSPATWFVAMSATCCLVTTDNCQLTDWRTDWMADWM